MFEAFRRLGKIVIDEAVVCCIVAGQDIMRLQCKIGKTGVVSEIEFRGGIVSSRLLILRFTVVFP